MPSSLIRRICQPSDLEPKVAIHTIVALGNEVLNNRVPIEAFVGDGPGQITPEEAADAGIILGKIAQNEYGPHSLYQVHLWLCLGEYGSYSVEQIETLLGLRT